MGLENGRKFTAEEVRASEGFWRKPSRKPHAQATPSVATAITPEPPIETDVAILFDSSEFQAMTLEQRLDQLVAGDPENKRYIPPQVHRGKGGRIRWNLPENTPEQNEQLGIKNVQGLFLESFPEFDDLFPRNEDGTVLEDKKEEAKDYISQRIGSSLGFRDVTSSRCLVQKDTPYFEGSYRVALQKSFMPWGIEFEETNKPQVDRKTGDYVDTHNETWVTIQYLCTLHGMVHPTIRGYLERENVRNIAGRDRSGRNTNLFNKEDALKILYRVSSLPQIDRETGVYTDEENNEWVDIEFLHRETGLSYQALQKILIDNVSAIQGRSRKTRKIVMLYLKPAAMAKIYEDVGNYIDQEMVTTNSLARKTGLPLETIRRQLNKRDIKFAIGRIRNNLQLKFYNESEAIQILQHFLELPRVDRKTKKYIDNNKRTWVTADYFHNKFGKMNSISLLRLLKNVPHIQGRAGGGKETMLYDEAEGLRQVDSYLVFRLLPQIDKNTGRYTEEKTGKSWICEKELSKAFGFDERTIRTMLEGVNYLRGRRNSSTVVLYDELEAVNRLKSALALPRVDKESGIFEDETGEKWALPIFFIAKLGIEYETFSRCIQGVSSIEGRNKANRKTQLFNISEVEAVLEKRVNKKRPPGYWRDPNVIEGAVQAFLSSGGEFSHKNLQLAGLHSVSYAIIKFYPGGTGALIEKLQIPVSQTASYKRGKEKDTHISSDEARAELMKLVEVEDE